MKNVDDMSSAEMVAEYNKLTGKNIKKFSSRAAGERQLRNARAEHATEIEQEAAVRAKLSSAVKESWKNPETAAKRAQRNSVTVVGPDGKAQHHRSVLAAFNAHGLPYKDHIRFRMALKASEGGKRIYEHEGNAYEFTIDTATPEER